jgi:nitrite reductase/ring-hydroxylating ferredoxin subunit
MKPSASVDEGADDFVEVRLAADTDLADGSMMSFMAPGLEPIAVYRVSGTLYATQDRCTHAHASLTRGHLDDHRVTCPVHGATFCIVTGQALCFPATESLRLFRVWVRDGVIYGDLRNAARLAGEMESAG